MFYGTIVLAILANIGLEAFKSWLAPKMGEYERKVVSTYSQKIDEGNLPIEEYVVVKGDTIDGIIYSSIETGEKSLEEVRYDISNINAAKGVDISILHPGDVIYLPVY